MTAQNGAGQANKGNIRVVVRTRPLAAEERGCLVKNLDESILVFDPAGSDAPNQFNFSTNRSQSANASSRRQSVAGAKRSQSAGRANRGVPSAPLNKARGRTRHKEHKFAFDYIFGQESKQEDVYQQTAKPLIAKLLEGYNCSCFAYGATGAGKTYTMSGTGTKPGIMYRAVTELYAKILELSEKKEVDLFVTFCEVYNEKIHDLLVAKPKSTASTKQSSTSSKVNPKDEGAAPARPDLQLLEKNGDIEVKNISIHKAPKADTLMRLLAFGNKNRTQHATDANATSSRSHAVFTIFVRQSEKSANIRSTFTMSKLVLVDLAGSERAAKVTASRGANRLKEGANINKSLLALGSVINALAAKSKNPKSAANKSKFVNYRNSKLTRILKDSLGGNCFTVMIANISPADSTYEDTWNTLCYAHRAKQIKADVSKSQVSVNASVAHYRDIANKQGEEITSLKRKLADAEEEVKRLKKEMEEKDQQIMDFEEEGGQSKKQKTGARDDFDSTDSDDSDTDATFIISNTPVSKRALNEKSRKTPVVLRSSLPKMFNIPQHLQAQMDVVTEERTRILRKAFRLCSELRSANLNTVVRTVNTTLKSSKKNVAADGIEEIKLQITGAKLVNAQSKSKKLAKLDSHLETNMMNLREIYLKVQALLADKSLGVDFEQGMHPAQLYMDIKTLQLDLDECRAQNSHQKYQIDILFNAWRRLVHVSQTAVTGFNLAYRMLKFNDMESDNLTEKMDSINRTLGNGVGFARVGLEQTRVFDTDSEHGATSDSDTDIDLSNEDLNRTIIRPSLGISKAFSSLFNLPKINSATENMSCEDWIVDDTLLKKLVFQGLECRDRNNDYSTLDSESDAEDDRTQDTTTANTSSRFGASNTSLPGTPSILSVSRTPTGVQPDISTPIPGILKNSGKASIQSVLCFDDTVEISTEDKENSAPTAEFTTVIARKDYERNKRRSVCENTNGDYIEDSTITLDEKSCNIPLVRISQDRINEVSFNDETITLESPPPDKRHKQSLTP